MEKKLPLSKRTYDDEFDVLFVKDDKEGNMICEDANGKRIVVDPFVGCAWPPEKSGDLLNKWARVRGHWYESYIFLVDEGGIVLH